jgi:hypothetical protein
LEDLNYKESLKALRLKWNDPNIPIKYGLFFILLLLSLLSFSFLKDKYYEHGNSFENYYWGIISALLIIFIIIFSIKALEVNERLIGYPIIAEPREVRKMIEGYLKKEKYTIYRSNDNYLLAKNRKAFARSSIVVIFNKKIIYINVQNQYGFRGYLPFSFGRNKRIVSKIISNINPTLS